MHAKRFWEKCLFCLKGPQRYAAICSCLQGTERSLSLCCDCSFAPDHTWRRLPHFLQLQRPTLAVRPQGLGLKSLTTCQMKDLSWSWQMKWHDKVHHTHTFSFRLYSNLWEHRREPSLQRSGLMWLVPRGHRPYKRFTDLLYSFLS